MLKKILKLIGKIAGFGILLFIFLILFLPWLDMLEEPPEQAPIEEHFERWSEVLQNQWPVFEGRFELSEEEYQQLVSSPNSLLISRGYEGCCIDQSQCRMRGVWRLCYRREGQAYLLAQRSYNCLNRWTSGWSSGDYPRGNRQHPEILWSAHKDTECDELGPWIDEAKIELESWFETEGIYIQNLPSCVMDGVGSRCEDGSLFAGIYGNLNMPIYVTECDVGQVFTNGDCVGQRINFSFHDWDDVNHNHDADNDGNLYDDSDANGEIVELIPVGNGVISHETEIEISVTGLSEGQSDSDGATNTHYHANRIDIGAPYWPAFYCDNLVEHGHDDWYLPALNELLLLYRGRFLIPGFNISGYGGVHTARTEPLEYTNLEEEKYRNFRAPNHYYNNNLHEYWSSTEFDLERGKGVSFWGDTPTVTLFKNHGHSVRCVRQ